jgi:6-phosphogluconolactonase
VTIWDVYVGTLTKEFATEVRDLRTGGNDPWRGNAKKVALREDGFPQGGRFAHGIEHFAFNDADASLQHLQTVGSDLVNPQYVTLHPTRPVLYAAEWSRPSRLSTFAIGDDGTLEPRAATPSLGELAVAAAVHPAGKVAYVAHWGDGALTAVSLGAGGVPVSARVVVEGDPRGVSQRAHHHQVMVTPNGRGLLVTDVGGDELIAYALDPDGVVEPAPIARLTFPVNSGPRHLEFHPSGKFVYVLGEWDSLLHVVAAEDGIPTKILGSVPTTPPGYDGKNKTSEIHLHPDGGALYVGNRNSNCVTVFAVDGDGGGVEAVEHQPTLGHGPACLRVDPSGRHLLVGNVYSGSFVVFRIGDDRRLQLVGEPVEACAPRSFVFHSTAVPQPRREGT